MSAATLATLDTIKCPHCRKPIKLTDAVAGPLLESARAQFERDLEFERTKAKEDGRREASTESARLNQQLSELTSKLTIAQAAQAAAVRKELELADARRELDLTIERQVTQRSKEIREKAQIEATDAAQLKVVEAQETIAGMARTIEDLRRKAEQGSTQLQGEAQELVLEDLLRTAFPLDTIEPVAKGQFGGDCLQKVVGPSGQLSGSILWESKRTKVFTAGWLVKLREDQRAAKAEVALLVTQVMPAGCTEAFLQVDGVWVCKWEHARAVATMLRVGLVQVAGALTANEGIDTKAKTVYRYLTGPRFKLHVQAIIEKQAALLDGLQKERTAMTRVWAQREGLINGVIDTTARLYGDLQGIAGKGLAEVEGLQLPGGEG